LGTRFNPRSQKIWNFFFKKFNMVCAFWIVLMCWYQKWFLKNKKTSLICILVRKIIWKAPTTTLSTTLLASKSWSLHDCWLCLNLVTAITRQRYQSQRDKPRVWVFCLVSSLLDKCKHCKGRIKRNLYSLIMATFPASFFFFLSLFFIYISLI
jgi:hypothetical protein